MNVSFVKKFQLFAVRQFMDRLNFILSALNKILFAELKSSPKNILIYRIGNIGDIVCAIPSFIAVRKNFPAAKITLLTSPGEKGAPGAAELLSGAGYLDELKIYFSEDIGSIGQKINFIKELSKNHCDLFVQIPNNRAKFRILLRNMFFAKALKAKSAFGFKIRGVQLFKKTQVDYMFNKTETESLLDILKENGVKIGKAEFDFNVSVERKNKVKNLLEKKWGKISKKGIVAAFCIGGKRGASQWPIERFMEAAKYLLDEYGAKIIVIGGKNDIGKAEKLTSAINKENVLIAAGKLDLLETLELLKNCSFLISGSTGPIHLAAAAGIKTVGIYGVRDIYGRWFPYGQGHGILYHKFIDCDYKKEECVKKSVEMISVEEVKEAIDEAVKQLSR